MTVKYLKLAPFCLGLALAANVSAAPIDAVVTGVVTDGLTPGETFGELASYVGYSFTYEFSLDMDVNNATTTTDEGYRVIHDFVGAPYYSRVTLTGPESQTIWMNTDTVSLRLENDADLSGIVFNGTPLNGLYDIIEFAANAENYPLEQEVVFFLVGSSTWFDNPNFSFLNYQLAGAQFAIREDGADTTFARVDTDSFSVATVPVPAAFWLFGSSLVGLVGFRRK